MTFNCWIELVRLSITKVDASYLYPPHAKSTSICYLRYRCTRISHVLNWDVEIRELSPNPWNHVTGRCDTMQGGQKLNL